MGKRLTRASVLMSAAPGAAPGITPCEAVAALFRARHSLPADVLRSLQDIWFCASAAQYGEAHEDPPWEPEDFREHDTAECEEENAATAMASGLEPVTPAQAALHRAVLDAEVLAHELDHPDSEDPWTPAVLARFGPATEPPF